MPVKFLENSSLVTFSLATVHLLSIATATFAQTKLKDYTEYSDRNVLEEPEDKLAEITQVNLLKDISPTDWAYEALGSLRERYDCISGFPNGTYRGKVTLSRYEFAAGLNSCLERIATLISSAEIIVQQDIEIINRLAQDFAREIAELDSSINNLELRTAFLEDHQFSTTIKLV